MLLSKLVAIALLPLAAESASSSSSSTSESSYAPKNSSCDDLIQITRHSDSISATETKWLFKSKPVSANQLHGFMSKSVSGFSDGEKWVQKVMKSGNGPTVGIAVSGGGYRAMLGGAGMLAAFDNRTRGASNDGLGGLLQGSTYISGLSGGAWLVSTLAGNNWTSVQDILDHLGKKNSIWDFSEYPFADSDSNNSSATTEWWEKIKKEVSAKQKAGFPVTLTDYLGHALGYNMFPNKTNGGASFTYSDIQGLSAFKDGAMPLPIIVANHAPESNQTLGPYNSTSFEFNPWELGSFNFKGWAQTKWLGTRVKNGVPHKQGNCIAGFDNFGWVMGTSASLFTPPVTPMVLEMFNGTSLEGELNETMTNGRNDVAVISPNPFNKIHFDEESTYATSGQLNLVDGGEDQQSIPLIPLLQKSRNVDVVFALDFSADTEDNWPNGTALWNTYQRQFYDAGSDISMPLVPSVEEFMKNKMNEKPSFFGCDTSQLKNLRHTPPLVVYIPNSKYSYASNTSTYKVSYTAEEQAKMIQNGFEAATMGNFTKDSDFRGCVACAIAARRMSSRKITLPTNCESCFAKYCYNGTAPNVA